MARDNISTEGAQHRFTSQNQPRNRGRKKGTPNRSTALRKLLACKVDLRQVPLGTKARKGTVEEQIILALIARAIRGNVPAIKEILDTVYGKVSDKHELSGEVRGGPIPITIIEAIKPSKLG
jgi:hypothetical protein